MKYEHFHRAYARLVARFLLGAVATVLLFSLGVAVAAPYGSSFPQWDFTLPSKQLSEEGIPFEWQLGEILFRRYVAEAGKSNPKEAADLEACYSTIFGAPSPEDETERAVKTLKIHLNPSVSAFGYRIDAEGVKAALGNEALAPDKLSLMVSLLTNYMAYPGIPEWGPGGAEGDWAVFPDYVAILIERTPLKDKGIGKPESRAMWCAVPWMKNALQELGKEPGWNAPDLIPPLLAEIDRVVATHFARTVPNGLPASAHPQRPGRPGAATVNGRTETSAQKPVPAARSEDKTVAAPAHGVPPSFPGRALLWFGLGFAGLICLFYVVRKSKWSSVEKPRTP